jgi:thiamine-monophosphate kinase
MDEFEFIRDVLSPLAGEGAFGLTDDAAVLHAGAGGLVVTADMLVEGRHFMPSCPPDTVAKKALRTNLSDLAAKGARPLCYMLSVAWPAARDMGWCKVFVRGLQEDQARYGVTLLGGDTTATDGPLTVSITAFGAPGPRGMIRRNGAQPGHAIYITGEIGAAGLGLRILQGETPPPRVDPAALIAAYRAPEPAVAFAPAIAEYAAAAIDVSDGVLADAAHVARNSGVLLEIELERLPLGAATRAWLDAQADRDAALTALATSGDDYQILFSANESDENALMQAARKAAVRLTRIGQVTAGQGLRILAAQGPIRPDRLGFTHF